MTIFRILVFTSLLVAVGCRSTSLKAPPDHDVPTQVQTQWVKDYLWAKAHETDQPTEACTKFQKLAKEPRFPESLLADLRSFEVCPDDKLVPFARSRYPLWMQNLALDVALTRAKKSGDLATEMNLSVEESKGRLPENEKLKWMQEALTCAHKIGNQDKIAELELREYKIAPRLIPHPKRENFLAVARDYRLARNFQKARLYYGKVVRGPFSLDDKIKALKGIRLSFKNERKLKDNLKAAQRLDTFLTRALKHHRHSQALLSANYDAQIYYGRALWTAGNAKGARRVFNHVEKQMKGSMSLAELYWLKGRVWEEKKNYDQVSKFLNLAMKEKISDPDLRDKILWYSAWNERRRRHYDQAVQLFQQLETETQTDFTRTRALYWLGRTFKDAHRDPEANQTFQKLADLDPVGYYGLLAHRSLGTQISLPHTIASHESHAPDLSSVLDKENADWLYWLGEKEPLAALLDLASDSYKKNKDQSDEGWLQLFKYYARAGLYMKLYNQIGNLEPERRKELLERHPDLLFPRPWSDEVHTASLQFGVPEELIYSIMRQESAFDPNSRSSADAFGLMQIIPEVGRNMSRRFKIPYTSMTDLYQPDTNIMIGAAHLKELLKRNKGRFILAVASYNANEDAIQNWLKNRYHGSPLEFIEEIPYEETRAYVRLVMRNMIFYSLLDSKSAAIQFPDWVLKMSAS